MKETTKEFIEIAYKAMQSAYYHECGENMENKNCDNAKKVGEVLQMVGDLSRS